MIASSDKEICNFLANYASWMLGCGATCIRIVKNVERMAGAFGINCEVTIMPSHILLSMWNADHSESYTTTCNIHKCGISFNINTLLSRLSWEVADKKLDYEGAVSSFHRIITVRPENKYRVLVLASLANGAFCRLFGGDFISVGIVFMATLLGYGLKLILLDYKTHVRIVFLCCAFVSSVISAAGKLFGLGDTPEIALGTSVLYLIPGIPYINSISDLLDGHYLCSFSRFMDAMVLTTCLSLGLCGGLFLMKQDWF